MIKMRIITVFVVACCLLSISCSSQTEEEQLRKMHSKPLKFNSDEYVCISHLYYNTISANTEFQLIRYIDARQCTSCSLKQLSYELLDSLPGNVTTKLVVNADKGKVALVKRYLHHLNGTMDIYVDTASCFRDINPQIPDNPLFHTFLINQNDSIVLVGDPLRNNKIRDLMINLLHVNVLED